jgi:hypothetical protein
LWLFWASILPEKTDLDRKRKLYPGLIWCFTLFSVFFFYIDGFFDMLYRRLVSVFKLNWVFRGKTL